jgi:BirA family biotin operon repressor/biotin-[acetyl-CoA-carboxylase] ligase
VADGGAVPGRAALDEGRLRDRVVRPGGLWREVTVVEATGSTNADLRAAARAGTGSGVVLAAELQEAGRGRLDRAWLAPPRASVAVSVLLRPPEDAADWGWLPLMVGTATAEAVSRQTGLRVGVKWPNDVLVSGRKVAGILAERVPTPSGPALVAGVGVNVSQAADELPPTPSDGPGPTSLLLAGAGDLDRTELTATLLERLAFGYRDWLRDPVDLRRRCLEWSVTVGARVRAQLPGGGCHEGLATGLDRAGRLVVATPDGPVAVAAGDIVHLRTAGSG